MGGLKSGYRPMSRFRCLILGFLRKCNQGAAQELGREWPATESAKTNIVIT